MPVDYAQELSRCWNSLFLNSNIEVCSEELKGCGILELKILKYLYNNPTAMIKEVTQTLNIPNSTFTNAINRLVAKGFVMREMSVTDLRSYKLTLTDSGKHATAEHIKLETKLLSLLISDFSEEDKSDLLKLLQQIVDKINKI